MIGFVVCAGDAVTALFSRTFPSLKTADLLQDREAVGRSLAAITWATVAMETVRDNTVWTGASLDLSKSDLQASKWMFSVFVLLSVVPVLVLHSC